MQRALVLKSIIFLFFLCITAWNPGAQEVDFDAMPEWLILEKGKLLYRTKDYGMAIRFFREAKGRRSVYPEAEYWIGAVFEAENEYQLAEIQYKKAYDGKNYLEIPAEALKILFKLVDIYDRQQHYNQYEETLKTIIDRNEDFTHPRTGISANALHRTLTQNGLDKLLELYRFKDDGTLSAFYQLGVFLYRTGRYNEAILHLTFSTVMTFTSIIDFLIEKDPEYRYESIEAVIEKLSENKTLSEFVLDIDLFGQLYYLASSLHEETIDDQARSMWGIVTNHGTYGNWANRAARQLQSPFTEPLLEIIE